jgi:hypothetical protein
LDLDRTGIKTLPPDIGNLKKLRCLRLDRNAVAQEEKDLLKKRLPDCFIVY